MEFKTSFFPNKGAISPQLNTAILSLPHVEYEPQFLLHFGIVYATGSPHHWQPLSHNGFPTRRQPNAMRWKFMQKSGDQTNHIINIPFKQTMDEPNESETKELALGGEGQVVMD